MAYYLGIDVGTSGTKTLVMDVRGRVLATALGEHGISAPRPSWSEQDPRQWWSATVKATKAALAKAGIGGRAIAGIGLSGQMHGLVCLGEGVEPLRPAIIWNDQRTAQQAEQIERKAGGKRGLIRLVGNVAMTSFTLTKLLWVKQNEPRVYGRIKHILLPKDYVRFRLTGEYAGDVSDMSGTLLLDQRRRDWSEKALRLFGIDRDMLPPVHESHEITGGVTARAARQLGLSPGTPVVAGAGDQPAGAVGNGIVRAGRVSATMGTSGVVFVHSPRYVTDPDGRVQTFCAAVAGEYCMFGCILAAGGSFQWFRNTLGQAEVAEAKRKGIDPYELLTRRAARAPLGCEGLFWLPYLTGERTPYADPFARACWVGIHSRTTRNELVRSVMEGATFAMNDALTILRQRGLRPRQIRLSGGGARSRLWRQMQADIYGSPCATVRTEEGPAYGVAILAAVGTGAYKSVPEACDAIVKVTRTIQPNPAARKAYARYYRQYRRLYPALRGEFAGIAAL
ncbi:MAG: xylulose kinase [Phycisphaerae bacterium SM23_33]|nr:MAG: xylulose kinase [Phycisphaerae bacterium SM23_33]